eukprot:TRINITY_DN1134_c2_g1_i2.p1 TRINITY_DN1134_c2_g1~~TRINITY_DN1134_c2_g1_i2.p1  ORF type:complete len:255 (+),score=40.32 TRINITY_DN1134_c2_g1_i2:47-811(+)
MLSKIVAACAVLAQVLGHPSQALRAMNVSCDQAVKGGMPVKYWSYHIHVLYWQHDQNSVDEAMALQNKFIKAFNIDPKAACDDSESTHGVEPALCIVDRDEDHPYCPFLTTEWAAFVPPQNLSAMIPFFTQNRGNLDVLVHPNSGCEVWDHLTWPMWSGNKWELDGTCLHYNCPGCDFNYCAETGKNLYTNITSASNPCRSQVCSQACTNFVNSAGTDRVNCPNYCNTNQVPAGECNSALAILDKWTSDNKNCH